MLKLLNSISVCDNVPVFRAEDRLQLKLCAQPHVGVACPGTHVCDDVTNFCNESHVTLCIAIHNSCMYHRPKEADNIKEQFSGMQKLMFGNGVETMTNEETH